MEINYNNELIIQPEIVQSKINNGYKFDIGRYLNEGWEIFKKEWLTFSIYSLLYMLIVFFATLTIIGIFFVAYPLLLGYFIGAHRVKTGQTLSLGDMFGGFKNLPQVALLTLIPVLVMSIFFAPFLLLGIFDADDFSSGFVAPTGALLMYSVTPIVGILLSMVLFFAPYLVVFGNYSAIDAIKTSWSLSIKQPLMIILFVILINFVAQFGIFFCLVGVFVSMAFAYICYYPAIMDVLYDETNQNEIKSLE